MTMSRRTFRRGIVRFRPISIEGDSDGPFLRGLELLLIEARSVSMEANDGVAHAEDKQRVQDRQANVSL